MHLIDVTETMFHPRGRFMSRRASRFKRRDIESEDITAIETREMFQSTQAQYF